MIIETRLRPTAITILALALFSSAGATADGEEKKDAKKTVVAGKASPVIEAFDLVVPNESTTNTGLANVDHHSQLSDDQSSASSVGAPARSVRELVREAILKKREILTLAKPLVDAGLAHIKAGQLFLTSMTFENQSRLTEQFQSTTTGFSSEKIEKSSWFKNKTQTTSSSSFSATRGYSETNMKASGSEKRGHCVEYQSIIVKIPMLDTDAITTRRQQLLGAQATIQQGANTGETELAAVSGQIQGFEANTMASAKTFYSEHRALFAEYEVLYNGLKAVDEANSAINNSSRSFYDSRLQSELFKTPLYLESIAQLIMDQRGGLWDGPKRRALKRKVAEFLLDFQAFKVRFEHNIPKDSQRLFSVLVFQGDPANRTFEREFPSKDYRSPQRYLLDDQDTLKTLDQKLVQLNHDQKQRVRNVSHATKEVSEFESSLPQLPTPDEASASIAQARLLLEKVDSLNRLMGDLELAVIDSEDADARTMAGDLLLSNRYSNAQVTVASFGENNIEVRSASLGKAFSEELNICGSLLGGALVGR